MGAWGERPYDNDTAADWFAGLLEPVAKQIEDLLNLDVDESNYDEYRAAAWFITKIGRNYVYPTVNRGTHLSILHNHLSRLHDRLQTIRNDNGWLDGWRDRAKIEAEMDNLIRQLQRVCKWNNVVITF